jgi:hypothetical protein
MNYNYRRTIRHVLRSILNEDASKDIGKIVLQELLFHEKLEEYRLLKSCEELNTPAAKYLHQWLKANDPGHPDMVQINLEMT